jgi:hypothetical protein
MEMEMDVLGGGGGGTSPVLAGVFLITNPDVGFSPRKEGRDRRRRREEEEERRNVID